MFSYTPKRSFIPRSLKTFLNRNRNVDVLSCGNSPDNSGESPFNLPEEYYEGRSRTNSQSSIVLFSTRDSDIMDRVRQDLYNQFKKWKERKKRRFRRSYSFIYKYFIIHGQEDIDLQIVKDFESRLRDLSFTGTSMMMTPELGSNILDEWEDSLENSDVIFLFLSPAYSPENGQDMLIYDILKYYIDKLVPLRPCEELLVSRYHNSGYHRWHSYLHPEEHHFLHPPSGEDRKDPTEKMKFIEIGSTEAEQKLCEALETRTDVQARIKLIVQKKDDLKNNFAAMKIKAEVETREILEDLADIMHDGYRRCNFCINECDLKLSCLLEEEDEDTIR